MFSLKISNTHVRVWIEFSTTHRHHVGKWGRKTKNSHFSSIWGGSNYVVNNQTEKMMMLGEKVLLLILSIRMKTFKFNTYDIDIERKTFVFVAGEKLWLYLCVMLIFIYKGDFFIFFSCLLPTLFIFRLNFGDVFMQRE